MSDAIYLSGIEDFISWTEVSQHYFPTPQSSDGVYAHDSIIGASTRNASDQQCVPLRAESSRIEDDPAVPEEFDYSPFIEGGSEAGQVEERFAPPEDFQYPFNDNSQEQEVNSDWIPTREEAYDEQMPTEHAEVHLHPEDGCPDLNEIEFMELEGQPWDSDDGLPEPSALFSEHRFEPEYRSDLDVGFKPADTGLITCLKQHKTEDQKRKPFVRLEFPPIVQPRPAVEGLSARTVLKTCFRIGEAIKICAPLPKPPSDLEPGDTLIELYGRYTPEALHPIVFTLNDEAATARVAFSERMENKQNFQFMDMFHDNAPFLNGAFEYWKRCELWDSDSALFLGQRGKGAIARIVGRIKRRDGGNGGTPFYIQIMMIWEVSWEEMEQSRRIITGNQDTGVTMHI